MAIEIKMPKMGNTVESVILGEVSIKVGDQIKVGDMLFDYETDKSTSEYKAEVAGEVLAVLVEPGEEVLVLSTVIIVGDHGEDISSLVKADAKEKPAAKVEAKEEVVEEKVEAVSTPSADSSEKAVSPRALKAAKQLDVKVDSISQGSGPKNRIVEKDILKFYHSDNQESGANQTKSFDGPEFIKVPYTGIRKAIAKSMEASLQHGAQLTLGAPFDATEILKLRKQIKENHEELGIANASINDIIVFALSRVLPKFPHINSIIGDDYIDAYNVAHIAVAVDTPNGLLVPVVKNASEKSLSEIANATKDLYKKAFDGKLTGKEQSGGTFTISNLGLSGVQFFTPILNPPQAALLGVGSPIKRIKLNKNDVVEEYSEITLSFTMDHRPFDGANGATFLKELIKILENIYVLLI